MGKVTFDNVMIDKTHPGTATKKSSKCFLKSLEHPQTFLDLFTYAGSFLNIPGTTATPKN